ncbi:MAG: ABC transporter ATP-binding protein [Lachnospiraceae bacterium]|nr:ABC transporter ATP-binding protein [Lachnospiraceae bacterium]
MREYENAIEISHLSKKYDGFALQDISLTVPKGCIMGFIGQNGAGKTTTIRSILNMMPLDSGIIHVLGYDHEKEECKAKEHIGFVFDEMGFHKVLNATDLNKMFRNIYKNWDETAFFQNLERFGLPKKKAVGKFSRGMQMKLQIAVALSHQAKLLIMDEPTSGLDPVVRNEILDIFLEFVQNEEHTILLSSHITSDLERIADYITFIDQGKILLFGERISILEDHGMIKCKKEEVAKIPSEYIVGKRVSQFSVEVLVKEKKRCIQECPEFLMEEVSLDEIMIFYISGSKGASA